MKGKIEVKGSIILLKGKANLIKSDCQQHGRAKLLAVFKSQEREFDYCRRPISFYIYISGG